MAGLIQSGKQPSKADWRFRIRMVSLPLNWENLGGVFLNPRCEDAKSGENRARLEVRFWCRMEIKIFIW